MRFLLRTARKDLQRFARDPLALSLWVGIPLMIGGLITLATGGSDGPRPTAHLLLADEDDTFLSELLARSAGGAGDILRIEEVTQEEGRRRIADGDGSALLILPEGFQDAVLEEEPAEIALLTNPAQRILPGIVEEMTGILVDSVFYLHRIFGDELQIIRDAVDEETDFPDADIARISIAVNRTMKRLEDVLFPPVLELEVAITGEEESGDSVPLGLLFLPGILIMALFFTTQGLSEDLWNEREKGTLARLLASPQSVYAFLGGKLLAGGLVLAGVLAAGLGAAALYFDLPIARLPLSLSWATFSGLVLLVAMFLVQLLASSRRGGQLVANTVTLPLLMAGGSFFPLEVMPAWMAAFGRVTPNGWAGEHLKDILLGRSDPAGLALAAGLLAIASLVLLCLCVMRVRAVLTGR